MGLIGEPSRKQYNWQSERIGPESRNERRDIIYTQLEITTPEGSTIHNLITVPAGFYATLISYYIEEADSDLQIASLKLDGTVMRRYNSHIVSTEFVDTAEYKYEEAPRFYKTLVYQTVTAPSAGPSIFIIIGYILEPAGEGYITQNN